MAIDNAGLTDAMPFTTPGEIADEPSAEELVQLEAFKTGKVVPQAVPTDEGVGEPETESEKVEATPKEPVRVPLSELQEERKHRQALEAELRDAREKHTRLDERLRLIAERVAPAKEEPKVAKLEPLPPEPDKDADYPKWLEYQLEKTNRDLAEQKAWREQATPNLEAVRQQQAVMQRQNFINQSEAAYASQNPAYFDSVRKLQGHIDAIFQPVYPDPAQRAQVIAWWTNAVVETAIQRGENPADMIYKVAKSAGLTEAEAQTAAVAATGQETTETASSEKPKATVAQLKKAATAAKTLSNTAGTAALPSMRLEDIEGMGDDEFTALLEKDPNVIKRYLTR